MKATRKVCKVYTLHSKKREFSLFFWKERKFSFLFALLERNFFFFLFFEKLVGKKRKRRFDVVLPGRMEVWHVLCSPKVLCPVPMTRAHQWVQIFLDFFLIFFSSFEKTNLAAYYRIGFSINSWFVLRTFVLDITEIVFFFSKNKKS